MIYTHVIGTEKRVPDGVSLLGTVSTHRQSGTTMIDYYTDGTSPEADAVEFAQVQARAAKINGQPWPLWV